ncbi:thymidylate synthase/dCMP hydroxymethylase domain-containing protein [Rhypophila decipiens]|uniref:thymidylate synthase n=1 Tax=Rhypophila decipiens TaxID=261697 RepID=A0AAN7B042_9PEZI|nr:thymidylate synthase/dCMP hydroxymethylase domain-containing protein [Rhypophila decipiens]
MQVHQPRMTVSTTEVTTPAPQPAARHEEYQYLDLVREILDDGELRRDRTGTGTYSIFAPRPLKFSLSTASGTPILPLLTTKQNGLAEWYGSWRSPSLKRVFTRAVIAELLWFIEGNTSSHALSSKGVKIWDGNGSREFLDNLGLTHREEGDLGPLARIIETLKTNPYDRRLILSAWNPKDLPKMVLPPCHMFAQFYPKQKGHLHCQLYQRSCDMGLGVPFNIASYALLTHMLAHVCDLVPGRLTHVMGDAHVYLNHVDALKTQLEREPREFPTLEIVNREKGCSIDGWQAEDFVIKGYNPHKTIAMEMSV